MDIDFVGLTAVTLIFGIPIVAIVSNAYIKGKKLAIEKLMMEQRFGVSSGEKQQIRELQQRLENLETIISAIDVDQKNNDSRKIN
ncbi:MAG: hypothetical protein EAZ97_07560 [Bacteroidetes bacterium]|nr:MAG: hypothetical protein EAZ97_07560 [Bacteroidota bacterium]